MDVARNYASLPGQLSFVLLISEYNTRTVFVLQQRQQPAGDVCDFHVSFTRSWSATELTVFPLPASPPPAHRHQNTSGWWRRPGNGRPRVCEPPVPLGDYREARRADVKESVR